MKENKILTICVLTLSIAIIFGSVWIGNSIKSINKDTANEQTANNQTNLSQSLYSQPHSKALMTEKEAAEYLNLSQDKFKELLYSEETRRKKLTSYDTFSFIPYLEIDGVKYFNKGHIDEWVEYNSMNRRKISTKSRL